jgi:hypothetical protein
MTSKYNSRASKIRLIVIKSTSRHSTYSLMKKKRSFRNIRSKMGKSRFLTKSLKTISRVQLRARAACILSKKLLNLFLLRKMKRKRRLKRMKSLNFLIFLAMIYLTCLKYGLMGKFSSRRMHIVLQVKNLQLKESGLMKNLMESAYLKTKIKEE